MRTSPKLVAMEVSVPDLSVGASGPFVVSMPVQRCVGPVVDRLQEVLRSHPGLAEVHLRLCNGRRTTVVRLDDKLRVRPSPGLLADLKQLLGPACVGGAGRVRRRGAGAGRSPAQQHDGPGAEHAEPLPRRQQLVGLRCLSWVISWPATVGR